MTNEFHARGTARREIRTLADRLELHYGIECSRAVEIIREEFDRCSSK